MVTINFLVAAYCCLLGFLLLNVARDLLIPFMQNRLQAGFPREEKDYGDVCTIYVANHSSGNPWFNVTDRLDVFVLAHSIGWLIKALIVRDTKLSWICSILFEVVELCFANLLPNFNECWWDSLLLDVFGCNLIGIHLADWLLSKFGVVKFDFINRVKYQHVGGESCVVSRKRNLYFKTLFSSLILIVFITLIDLNFFFLKFILSIPTTHWVCYVRTLLWIGASVPSAIELYNWSSARSRKKDSFIDQCPSCVVGAIGLLLEIMVCYKFSDHLFDNSATTPILTYVLVLSLLYATIWSWLQVRGSGQ